MGHQCKKCGKLISDAERVTRDGFVVDYHRECGPMTNPSPARRRSKMAKPKIGEVVAYLDDAGGETFFKVRRIDGPLVYLWGLISPRPFAKLRQLNKSEVPR